MGNSNSSEVGACNVNVESYKCSINKITVSTKWKAPAGEVPETASTTVFDKQKVKSGRTIYVISSPEGKKITLKTERQAGKCQRNDHMKYVISKDDSSGINLNLGPGLGNKGVTGNAAATQSSNKSADEPEIIDIKDQQDIIIKCFKIEGFLGSFPYLSLPIPTLKNYTTSFKYDSCQEGSIKYKIISYPDISFKLEGSIGSEAKKNRNKTSPFEKKTSSLKYVPSQLQTINTNSLGVELKLSPSLTASTTYNGGKDKLELNINFDANKEIVNFKYKHDSNEIELGSEALQNISGIAKKFINLIKLLKKISEIDFIKEFVQFDSTKLVKNYKPYQLSLASPNALVCFEGKYHVSKDLSRIGKYLDVGIAAEPLIKISFKIDLLFLILSAVSAGTATGFYVMLKNLDKVIGKILGNSYKKKYKDTKPFSADIYFDFIISGAINGSVHWIIDTTQKKDPNSFKEKIEGVLKVDLEAGAKCQLDILIVAVEAEVSASASSGIKLVLGLENHMLEGGGIDYLIEGIFMGLKLKYCVTGKVGFMKTTSYGRNLLDGNPTLLKESKLFSEKFNMF